MGIQLLAMMEVVRLEGLMAEVAELQQLEEEEVEGHLWLLGKEGALVQEEGEEGRGGAG